MTLRNN